MINPQVWINLWIMCGDGMFLCENVWIKKDPPPKEAGVEENNKKRAGLMSPAVIKAVQKKLDSRLKSAGMTV